MQQQYEPFGQYFPKIALKETRVIYIPKNKEIPEGNYIFQDTYCVDKKCDCRRTIISVYPDTPGAFAEKPLAYISFGWEDLKFYKKLLRGFSDEMVMKFKDPMLDMMYDQSAYAPFLLASFINLIETDTDYVASLERHYAYYKDRQGTRLSFKLKRIMRRFEPCPCESGKIYNHCCGKQ